MTYELCPPDKTRCSESPHPFSDRTMSSPKATNGSDLALGNGPGADTPMSGVSTKGEDLKQKDEDRKLASRIADVIASSLDKVKPITDMITRVSISLIPH
jgi:hypothetical protein